MTFERLVRDIAFVSEVITVTVGQLRLERPEAVWPPVNARSNVETTAHELAEAHRRAVHDGVATMLHTLAVPFVNFEDQRATDVKPDFAIVASQREDEGSGSWLIMGDAKDYERVRSRIDDGRLLKGFLQVALGAESAESWSRLPDGMRIHGYGVLAVPRNAFLQPGALVEDLTDHRQEVRMRVTERRRTATDLSGSVEPDALPTDLKDFVDHLHAAFDPATCPSCSLFNYCRNQLRTSTDPADVLVEIGVLPEHRRHVLGLVDGTGTIGEVPDSVRAQVIATHTGIAEHTGQKRTDPAGEPGTVNVVLAKSDSAALGVYGIGIRSILHSGDGDWEFSTFDDPQSAETRKAVMSKLGSSIIRLLKDQRQANPDAPSPIHLVVPDRPTADLLASMADNLAGVELSRIRWARDKEQGRPALTFNGEPATIPPRLSETQRTGVSFLLEDDRARALTLRTPIVDLRSVLARHILPGGPLSSGLRLDYLVQWANSSGGGKKRHREISDDVESSVSTPGARLSTTRSNAIHRALAGDKPGQPRPADPTTYNAEITEELGYKAAILDRALAALSQFQSSNLREVYRALEGDAQAVWRRRLELHAFDLVRFGRTSRFWRNTLVPTIEADDVCRTQLLALCNPQAALDAAQDAGTRQLCLATVVSTNPVVLDVDSRRIGDGDRIVLLHVNDQACVEHADVSVKHLKGSFKIDGLSAGLLTAVDDPASPRRFEWDPHTVPDLKPGDRLVVADFLWFCNLAGSRYLSVTRPGVDTQSAPKPDCDEDSFLNDPESHQYCCQPHEHREAQTADYFAEQRALGLMNPEVWPPIVDTDAFEVSRAGAPQGDPSDRPPEASPDGLTIDDVD